MGWAARLCNIFVEPLKLHQNTLGWLLRRMGVLRCFPHLGREPGAPQGQWRSHELTKTHSGIDTQVM